LDHTAHPGLSPTCGKGVEDVDAADPGGGGHSSALLLPIEWAITLKRAVCHYLSLFYCASIDAPEDDSIVPSFIEATGDQVYVRFHGRNHENWFKRNIRAAERFKYLYSKRELTVARHCYQNFGIMNATTMAAILRGQEQIARAGENGRTILKAACKGNGSIRRTYAVPSGSEVARGCELGIRSQIRWLPGAGNQERGPREADVSERE
jgi:hypothetical protein